MYLILSFFFPEDTSTWFSCCSSSWEDKSKTRVSEPEIVSVIVASITSSAGCAEETEATSEAPSE